MRKYFWIGGIGTLVVAVCLCATASYASQHPDSFLAQFATLVYKVGFKHNPAFYGAPVGTATDQGSCEESEAPTCVAGEPEPITVELPARPVAIFQPVESTFSGIIPALPDADADCQKIMPHCGDEDTIPPPLMPRIPEESAVPKTLGILMNSPESVNKRLQGLLQEYQSPEIGRPQRRADTLEFRPSDARKDEFGPIPF